MTETFAQLPHASPPVCLTIAGFDPSSGAGVTADLKTFAAHGVYGAAAITALTVQSTVGVVDVELVRPSLLRNTLSCLADDLDIAAVKIGMLGGVGLADETLRFLRKHPELRARTVLDPVMRSSSGRALLDGEGLDLLREELLGVVGWVTPNLDELHLLTDVAARAPKEIEAAAARLADQAARAGNARLGIIVTGGHLDQPHDYLLVGGQGRWFEGERVETQSTHGTGCAFSSAVTARLAHGEGAAEAVSAAKRYVAAALMAAYPVGRGCGPMNHLFSLDRPGAVSSPEVTK